MLGRIKRKLARILRPRAKQDDASVRLSLVVPAYNVEPYIDRFLASVFGQTSRLGRFEVIVVDDGSTDRTAEIVRDWQSRYPRHMRYVHQANGGPSAARNTGMALARGTWISFPDPDDFLDPEYFREMLKETERPQKKPLLAVVSNLIFYHEDRDAFIDRHPLRYRFKNGTIRKISHDLGDFMQFSTATCWFDREAVIKHSIRFDERVAPSFEDAHWLNKLFLSAPDRTISFVPAAKYYYRKREAKNSILDRSTSKPSFYLGQIEFGYLDLLKFSKKTLGSVPQHVQRLCLYELVWRFRHIVDHEERIAFLTETQRDQFLTLVADVFEFIDPDVIEKFDLAGCTEEHRVALLGIYKKERPESTAIYLNQIDMVAGLVQFSFFSGAEDDIVPSIFINGRETTSRLSSKRRAEFMRQTYFHQHFLWVAMEDGDRIAFEVDGRPCRIRYRGKGLGSYASWLSLRNALVPPSPTALDDETARLRNYVLSMESKFGDCHVLMDRDDRADDNAEHLYRHMMATGRTDNAWFILSRDSLDWDRLMAEGFRLLAYGSDDHIAAHMNAATLISSHADHYVLLPVPSNGFSDIVSFDFVFLQHGVAVTDISRWLNPKPIRLFVTSMLSEYDEVSSHAGPYLLTEREALLSGLPRHDALAAKAEESRPDSILIIPTWRKYLTELTGMSDVRRKKVEHFPDSDFAKHWKDVLKSTDLMNLARKHGLRIVFAPHPNMSMYIEDMEIPSHIEVIDIRTGPSYQDLFVHARVAITDYSSAISEIAYLQRPVIYFQFDSEEMFNGEHVCREGYFSFERDGFGPVAKTAGETIRHLADALSGCEDPVYAERRRVAFPFRDGGCCERVCVAIEKLGEKRPRLSPLHATEAAASAARASGGRLPRPVAAEHGAIPLATDRQTAAGAGSRA